MSVTQVSHGGVVHCRIFGGDNSLSTWNLVPRTGLEPVRPYSGPRILSPILAFLLTFNKFNNFKIIQRFMPVFRVVRVCAKNAGF